MRCGMVKAEELGNPKKRYRPEVRWWLAEGFHTDQTLKNDIRLLDESGFGAVEFLAMEDEGVDSSEYGWGSEEWVHDSRLIIAEATERGMGVSTTSGTNWANANLTTITPDDQAASKELDFVSVTRESAFRESCQNVRSRFRRCMCRSRSQCWREESWEPGEVRRSLTMRICWC